MDILETANQLSLTAPVFIKLVVAFYIGKAIGHYVLFLGRIMQELTAFMFIRRSANSKYHDGLDDERN